MFLKIQSKKYLISEIASISDISFSDFEQKAVEFIKDWQNGKEMFELSTSGTTGNPTLIKFTRKQMQLSAEMTAKAFQLEKGQTILVCLNTDFVAGKMMLVRALHLGMNIILEEPSSNPLLHSKDNIHFTALVPLQLEAILNNKISAQKANQLNTILVGGAPISSRLEEKVKHLTNNIFHTYAMTETLSHVAVRKLNNNKQSTYNVLDGVKIQQDDRGCLIVESPVNFGEKIITNDNVQIISENEFIWLGRIDNVINSGGIKIHIEALESKIEPFFVHQKSNSSFFVDAISDAVLGQKIVICIENKSFLVEELNDFFKKNLSKYEIPKEIYFVNSFHRTPTGKILRKETLKHIV